MSVEAATDAAVFHAYLAKVLLPELRRTKPDAVLVMDNLTAHKAPRVRALLDGSGFAYRYLPAYSPDLNPIEPGWAKVKAELRGVAARTADALREACGPALAAITPQDAAGFFRHCRYRRPSQPAKCSRAAETARRERAPAPARRRRPRRSAALLRSAGATSRTRGPRS